MFGRAALAARWCGPELSCPWVSGYVHELCPRALTVRTQTIGAGKLAITVTMPSRWWWFGIVHGIYRRRIRRSEQFWKLPGASARVVVR